MSIWNSTFENEKYEFEKSASKVKGLRYNY